MSTGKKDNWLRGRASWFAAPLALLLVAAFAWLAWRDVRLSSEEQAFVGTWTNDYRGSVILRFRADRTLYTRSPGSARAVFFATWHVDDSQLTIRYSGRGAGDAVRDFLQRPASDSYPILRVSHDSIVLATPSGKRTLVRREDSTPGSAP